MNVDRPFVIFDTGEGYAFETGKTCSYGKLLLAIAYMSKGNLKAVYREILEKRYNIWLLDNGERQELTDEDRQREVSIEEILDRYPLPEFLDERYTATANTLEDEIAAIDKNALECIEAVLHTELVELCDRMVDDVESTMPLFLIEDKFVEEVEDVLLNKDFQKIDMNKYCKNQLLSVAVQFVDGRMIKVYCVNSLMQLIAIELLAINGAEIKYSRCPVCKKVYEQGKGKGGTRKYCAYPYKKGLCSGKGQKIIDNNRAEIEKKRKSLKNTIHHFWENHKNEFDIYDWYEELDVLHEELVKQGVSNEEYEKKIKKWYKEKKETLAK